MNPSAEFPGGAQASKASSPIPLMQIATGFWASKTLAAAIEFDLFTKLSVRGADAAASQRILGLPARPTEMLLSGCAALGLLEKRGGLYYNSPLAEEYLVRGKPYYFGGFVTMLDRRLYLAWDRLPAALRSDQAQTWGDKPGLFEAMASSPEEQRIFTEAMHSFSVQSGQAVAAAFDFSPFAQLLDVGGGSGAYCIEAARRYPRLRAVVFDLPSALAIAKEKIAESGFGDRVRTEPGDFFHENLPTGSDVILLSTILHDWTAQKNVKILENCFQALPSHGAVIVSELMMNDDKTGPVPAALMSLNMLIETEGRNYSWAEYTRWLEQAGFGDIKRVPIESPGANGLLIGRKP
ncbi:MAG TPA: methyltransferase [Candidatus Acidoferrales bacterium]|nr:methyltransferase [Candidatus Acidoferrales bacterium]